MDNLSKIVRLTGLVRTCHPTERSVGRVFRALAWDESHQSHTLQPVTPSHRPSPQIVPLVRISFQNSPNDRPTVRLAQRSSDASRSAPPSTYLPTHRQARVAGRGPRSRAGGDYLYLQAPTPSSAAEHVRGSVRR